MLLRLYFINVVGRAGGAPGGYLRPPVADHLPRLSWRAWLGLGLASALRHAARFLPRHRHRLVTLARQLEGALEQLGHLG